MVKLSLTVRFIVCGYTTIEVHFGVVGVVDGSGGEELFVGKEGSVIGAGVIKCPL